MIYFLHGTDIHTSRAKLHELLLTLSKKRPHSEVFKITSENWSETQFEELLVAQGLFDTKYIVVLDHLLEKKEIKEFIMDRVAEAQSSQHVFLMIEGKTDAPTLKRIEAVAEKSQEFVVHETKEKSFGNIFSIANHLIYKDKKNLWISYIGFLGQGIVAEEIHGVLFWQVKNMLLASRTSSQKESGLSPFVYKNALTGARNFIQKELVELSSKLLDMTHRVRRGNGEMEIMLEKAILEL